MGETILLRLTTTNSTLTDTGQKNREMFFKCTFCIIVEYKVSEIFSKTKNEVDTGTYNSEMGLLIC